MDKDFTQPHEISRLDLAFPSSVKNLMPEYDDIPETFKSDSNPWVKWQQRWFFEGLKDKQEPKPGIDIGKALRHLKVIQSSFEPRHEHKEAAVAYLASLWLVNPNLK